MSMFRPSPFGGPTEQNPLVGHSLPDGNYCLKCWSHERIHHSGELSEHPVTLHAADVVGDDRCDDCGNYFTDMADPT